MAQPKTKPTPSDTRKHSGWKNSIVSHGELAASEFLANPDNWKIHPTRQQEAMKGALIQVGWTDEVTVNLRRGVKWPKGQRGVQTLLDGHMRVTLALREGDQTPVPVQYVDLDPEQEAYYVATHDPLGQLAGTDAAKLQALASQFDAQDKVIMAALRGAGLESRQTFPHMEGEPDGAGGESVKPRTSAAAGPDQRSLYPLAIVLERRDWERWGAIKARLGTATDREALVMILDKLEAGDD
jgi:hypothetical protein